MSAGILSRLILTGCRVVAQSYRISAGIHRQLGMVACKPEDPPEDLSSVDARIAEHGKAIQMLKEQCNDFSPLFQLPVELILAILYFLLAGDEPNVQSLLFCSQLCRRIRSICLTHPSLWREAIDMTASHELMTMVLQRSAPLPFSIGVDLAQWNSEDQHLSNCIANLATIASSLHRMNEFHLHASASLSSAVLSQFPPHAPALQALHLRVSGMMGDSNDLLRLPDSLMMLDAPSLQTLCLYRCAFSWERFTFRTLVELRIVDSPDNAKPSLMTILSTLSNLPLLQILVMKEVLLGLNNSPEQRVNPVQVQLLQLRYLCIHCPIMDCTIFLDAIATRELQLLELVCLDLARDPTAAEMSKFQAALYIKTRAINLRSASMHCDFDTVRLIGSTFAEVDCEDSQALVMVTFNFIHTADEVLHRLVAFCKGIVASQVQCVRLHIDPAHQAHIDEASWESILSLFPLATHIHITQPLRFSVLSCLLSNALQALRLATDNLVQSYILLPHLTLLDTSPDDSELEFEQWLLHEIGTLRNAYMIQMEEAAS
ncbi:hypothetical protein P692DRAFT_20876050 [Suillus brevipes Sb2]|nr:hypothetical protein P692DRAFT_20876050 [Suillus brevipes Sb2]